LFVPVTGWLPAAGVGSVRVTMEMRARFGLLQAAPAYQTCGLNHTSPDTAIILPIENGANDYADADGCWELSSSGPVSPSVGAKNDIRFGWLIKTSGAIGGACVGAKIEVMV
jgi:hypothetical protein